MVPVRQPLDLLRTKKKVNECKEGSPDRKHSEKRSSRHEDDNTKTASPKVLGEQRVIMCNMLDGFFCATLLLNSGTDSLKPHAFSKPHNYCDAGYDENVSLELVLRTTILVEITHVASVGCSSLVSNEEIWLGA